MRLRRIKVRLRRRALARFDALSPNAQIWFAVAANLIVAGLHAFNAWALMTLYVIPQLSSAVSEHHKPHDIGTVVACIVLLLDCGAALAYTPLGHKMHKPLVAMQLALMSLATLLGVAAIGWLCWANLHYFHAFIAR